MVSSFYPHPSTMSYTWPWQLPPHGQTHSPRAVMAQPHVLLFTQYSSTLFSRFLRVTKWLNLLEVWQVCVSTTLGPSKGSTRSIGDSRAHCFAIGKVCRCWQVKQHPPPSMTTLLCLCHWIFCFSHPCLWWLNTIQLDNTKHTLSNEQLHNILIFF